MNKSFKEIHEQYKQHGQGHVFNFYNELSEEEQNTFLEQLAKIDLKQLDSLVQNYVLQNKEIEIPSVLIPPEIIPFDGGENSANAREKGRECLSDGKVAAFVVAGGQGTRLGYDGPKGCYPATPIKKKSLFCVFAEQILGAQKKYNTTIPWYVMTSPVNHDATLRFFEENNYWGLNPNDVMLFIQGVMPAVDYNGKLLLKNKGALAVNPDGHGGSLTALNQSGAIDDMKTRGVETISYFQVDNPVVRCLDPLFIGLHVLAGAGMSAKALQKRDPLEKLGNFCMSDGRVVVIEYSDMPDELARKENADGSLVFKAGSIAIHLLDRKFIEDVTSGTGASLPFHRADKKVPFINSDGNEVFPDTPNAVKFERFVFDAMSISEQCVIYETRREEEFSPIKNSEGEDSPASCATDQITRAASWLESAGVKVPYLDNGEVDAVIEISALYGNSADDIKAKADGSMVINSGQELYLD